MKKIIVFFISFYLMALNNFFIVKADDLKIGKINIVADVPENFDRDINILVEYEDSNTGLFTLKLNNNYKVESIIPTGVINIKKVDILGNIGQYNLSYPSEILVEKDSLSKLDISIEEVELNSIGEDINQPSNEYSNSNILGNNKESSNKSYENNKENSKMIETKNRLLKNAFSTGAILVIVLALYLFGKYKKEH